MNYTTLFNFYNNNGATLELMDTINNLSIEELFHVVNEGFEHIKPLEEKVQELEKQVNLKKAKNKDLLGTYEIIKGIYASHIINERQPFKVAEKIWYKEYSPYQIEALYGVLKLDKYILKPYIQILKAIVNN